MSSDNNNNAQQQRPDTQGLDVLSALCGGVSKNGFDGTHQLPTTTGRRNPVLAQQNQQATGQNHQFGQMHGNHHIMPADATSFMNQGLYIGGGQHQHQLTHPQHQQQQISNVSSSAAAGVQQGDLLTHQALNIMLQQQLLASMKAGPIDHLGVHPGPGASSAPTPAPATNHQGVQGMVSHLHRLGKEHIAKLDECRCLAGRDSLQRGSLRGYFLLRKLPFLDNSCLFSGHVDRCANDFFYVMIEVMSYRYDS